MEQISGAAPTLVYILIAGAFATGIWRVLGVVFAGNVREDSEIFRWVRAVATALIAGIIARLILFPSGALALAPLWLRIGAAGTGFAIAMKGKKWAFVGILAAEIVLIGGWLVVV
ncbi:AzlD domain-containing protein [Rhodobium gokarnense]|uniref:Branched-chain amino acid transport n=1 Tax=Rhodobium gokarnense TaxID=364296 RepID=A0ABT3HA29_9HYPH|nr:AzlD domain-containing protein [Rhodobium gokarnense]MCW2307257.1 hypothetical protein [Rhodobium gokarnense]